MIRVGIVGCNYGRTVLLPAFRADRRCEVVALAGTDAARAAELARAANVARGTGEWSTLVEDRAVDAIAIAVPPSRQPEIALAALDRGKAVFAEKPLAADLAGARAMLESGQKNGSPDHDRLQFSRASGMAAGKGDAGRRRGRPAAPCGGHLERRKPGDTPASRELEDARRRRRRPVGELRQPLLSLSRMVLRPDRGPQCPRLSAARREARRRSQHRGGPGLRVRRGGKPADELRVLPRLRPPHRALWRRRDLGARQPNARLFSRIRARSCAAHRSCFDPGRGRGLADGSPARFPGRSGVPAGPAISRRVRERRLGRSRLRRGLSGASVDRCGQARARDRPLRRCAVTRPREGT